MQDKETRQIGCPRRGRELSRTLPPPLSKAHPLNSELPYLFFLSISFSLFNFKHYLRLRNFDSRKTYVGHYAIDIDHVRCLNGWKLLDKFARKSRDSETPAILRREGGNNLFKKKKGDGFAGGIGSYFQSRRLVTQAGVERRLFRISQESARKAFRPFRSTLLRALVAPSPSLLSILPPLIFTFLSRRLRVLPFQRQPFFVL